LIFIKNIPSSNLSDTELIGAYKNNADKASLGKLYGRYMELVFGVCLKYFKDGERAKDAVMDIYEELCIKLLQHEVGNFKAWLAVVARNHCLMQLRSPKNMKLTEFNPDFMQIVQHSHLKNEVLEKEENFVKLEQCIETLPADQQQSIQLFFLQKKCYNEIAELTGYEWSKVRSHIQNGKRNLKLCLDEKGVFTGNSD
jgi:RNA polymerase sigma-70 factor (ECF subfamily)